MESNMVYKSQLTPQQLLLLQSEFEKKKLSKNFALFLTIFLGFLGFQRIYTKDYFRAALYFLTGGLLLIGWVIDIFVIRTRVEEVNEKIEMDLIKKMAQVN